MAAEAAEATALRVLTVSRFALDGGAMHGIVPRFLWEPGCEVDARHRIPLAARVLVVDVPKHGIRVVIEAGLGQAWSSIERRRYVVADGPELPEQLAAAGVDPLTVTHVLLTHVHWDHAGGMVLRGGGTAFPNATHVVGRAHWAHANAPSLRDAGSFRAEDLAAIAAGPLTLWSPGEPLIPGIEARISNGHTPGLLVPWIEREGRGPVAFPADLVPTLAHARPAWGMAYDVEPLRVTDEKVALLADLAARGGCALLYHDVSTEAAWPAADGTAQAGTIDAPGAP